MTDTLRGICKHGKVRFMCSTEPDILKHARKDISDMVLAGFTFDKVPVEVARQSDMNCVECDEQTKPLEKK